MGFVLEHGENEQSDGASTHDACWAGSAIDVEVLDQPQPVVREQVKFFHTNDSLSPNSCRAICILNGGK